MLGAFHNEQPSHGDHIHGVPGISSLKISCKYINYADNLNCMAIV